MADVDAVGRALAVAGTRVSPSVAGGEIRVIADTYTANTLAEDSTIEFGSTEIPAGARITYAELGNEIMGAATTLALTVGSDTIIAAASSATATTRYNGIGVIGLDLTDGGIPIVTLAGAASTGSDRLITVVIHFTCY